MQHQNPISLEISLPLWNVSEYNHWWTVCCGMILPALIFVQELLLHYNTSTVQFSTVQYSTVQRHYSLLTADWIALIHIYNSRSRRKLSAYFQYYTCEMLDWRKLRQKSLPPNSLKAINLQFILCNQWNHELSIFVADNEYNVNKRQADYKKLKLQSSSCQAQVLLSSSDPNSVKLDKIPEYLRDTVDWFMG